MDIWMNTLLERGIRIPCCWAKFIQGESSFCPSLLFICLGVCVCVFVALFYFHSTSRFEPKEAVAKARIDRETWLFQSSRPAFAGSLECATTRRLPRIFKRSKRSLFLFRSLLTGEKMEVCTSGKKRVVTLLLSWKCCTSIVVKLFKKEKASTRNGVGAATCSTQSPALAGWIRAKLIFIVKHLVPFNQL